MYNLKIIYDPFSFCPIFKSIFLLRGSIHVHQYFKLVFKNLLGFQKTIRKCKITEVCHILASKADIFDYILVC